MAADVTGRPPDDAERLEWVRALDLWGVQVHVPEMVRDARMGAFAWFSFPPSVHVDLDELARQGAQGHLFSVFAHEIGHHVLSPSTRVGSFTLLHQMARAITASDPRRSLPVASTAALLSNLWSDMLINERVARMQRRVDPVGEPDMIAMWRTLTRDREGARASGSAWWVILRAYEMLWSLPSGSLCAREVPEGPAAAVEAARRRQDVDPDAIDVSSVRERDRDKARAHHAAALRVRAVEDELILGQAVRPDVDAGLLADAVRTFGADPVSGALSFGMILAPYLVIEAIVSGATSGTPPGGLAGGGCIEEPGEVPTAAELAEVLGDPRLSEPPVHPAMESVDAEDDSGAQSYGVAETLALFSGADPLAVLLAWYESEARRWIRPLTQRGRPPAANAIPGPLAVWELGDDLTDLDWSASLAASPTVVPGVTTRRRTELPDEPAETRDWVALDLYVDSSGSMVRPSRGSPAVLAGTILTLSVLKGGGRVRVTSWSGPGQVAGGSVFTRDRLEVMRQLTTFFGGGTTFPLDLLAARYPPEDRGRSGERRHLVVLSDDGLSSFFGTGQEAYAGVAARVRRVVDTATLLVEDRSRSMALPAAEAGYDVGYLDDMASAPRVCADLAARIAGHHG
ncbi:VWA domain-containing protein [Mycolicibacterium sediminis]|uniref:VWA domain-containing protein n=1 Tax=Mycolicibacterium sediminis TaxID=1286180 RepID=A0A7I7QPY7_9MYCO|nr:VWA domain-containing protein [Mycolicibacterium sediminis]BBY28433.1 hypothetical protein MSEDJ_25290 [Mycolicibacterium sediminis]